MNERDTTTTSSSGNVERSVVSRRKFLGSLGAGVVVAVAGGIGISVWTRNRSSAGIPRVGGAPTAGTAATSTTRSGLPPGSLGIGVDRTLIIIEMGGGNDGLNTVVPHALAGYYDQRGALAITEPIDLDGEIGLHPALTFLADRYALDQVAVIEGIGYPDPDLSHFASMANWWSGSPNTPVTTGWLGRYLDGTIGADDPLAGVSIGPGPSPAMLGDRSFVISLQDMTGLSPIIPQWVDRHDEIMGMGQGFSPAAFDGTQTIDVVRDAIAATVTAQSTVNDILGAPDVSAPTAGPQRRRGTDLEQSMEVAAALITSSAPPRVVYIHGWGDFDTHEGQAGRHQAMMQDLNTALAGFFTAIESAGMAERVTVMTTSEFGRRVAFNGSGTDHGTAGAHFVIGHDVIGGRYGERPSLTNLDQRGNMFATVDYRSVYTTILGGWMGVDPVGVLGGDFEMLPVFR